MTEWDVIVRTLAALVAGGSIGLERSYHGRAAGLRTYALVCFGSALLVAATQFEIFGDTHGSGDVTRVIQGIVTGIGFLGGGVIIQTGFSVRGLTTSASIWVASAIGVVIGTGSYLTGVVAAATTLIALTVLRGIEDRLPTQSFIQFEIAFERASALDEDGLRQLLDSHRFSMRELSSRLHGAPPMLEYQTVIWTNEIERLRELRQALMKRPDVVHFTLSPSRD